MPSINQPVEPSLGLSNQANSNFKPIELTDSSSSLGQSEMSDLTPAPSVSPTLMSGFLNSPPNQDVQITLKTKAFVKSGFVELFTRRTPNLEHEMDVRMRVAGVFPPQAHSTLKFCGRIRGSTILNLFPANTTHNVFGYDVDSHSYLFSLETGVNDLSNALESLQKLTKVNQESGPPIGSLGSYIGSLLHTADIDANKTLVSKSVEARDNILKIMQTVRAVAAAGKTFTEIGNILLGAMEETLQQPHIRTNLTNAMRRGALDVQPSDIKQLQIISTITVCAYILTEIVSIYNNFQKEAYVEAGFQCAKLSALLAGVAKIGLICHRIGNSPMASAMRLAPEAINCYQANVTPTIIEAQKISSSLMSALANIWQEPTSSRSNTPK